MSKIAPNQQSQDSIFSQRVATSETAPPKLPPLPKRVFLAPSASRVVTLPEDRGKEANEVATLVAHFLADLHDENADIFSLKQGINFARRGSGGRKLKFNEELQYHPGGSGQAVGGTSRWPRASSPVRLHNVKPKPSKPGHYSKRPSLLKAPPKTPPKETSPAKGLAKKPSMGRDLLRKASAWALPSRKAPTQQSGTPTPSPSPKPKPKPPPVPQPPAWCYHPPTRKAVEEAAKRQQQNKLSEVRPAVTRHDSAIQPPPKKKTPSSSVKQDASIAKLNKHSAANLPPATKPQRPKPRTQRPKMPHTSSAPAMPTGRVKSSTGRSTPRPSRPQIRGASTTSVLPTASSLAQGSRSFTYSSYPPPLASRPTIADLIAQDLQSGLGDVPPLPPIPAQFLRKPESQETLKAGGQETPKPSKPSQFADGMVCPAMSLYKPSNQVKEPAPKPEPVPNPYGGNAFAPGGYWASQTSIDIGLDAKKQETKAPTKKVLKKKKSMAKVPVAKSVKNASAHSSMTAKSVKNTSAHSSMTATTRTRSISKPVSMASTTQRTTTTPNTSFDTTRNTTTSFYSVESDKPNVSLVTAELWASIGRMPGQYQDIEHPFPQFTAILLRMPEVRQAYLSVRDALVAHYLGYRAKTPSSVPSLGRDGSGSSVSLSTFLSDSRRPSTSRTGSTSNPFRIFPVLSRTSSAVQDMSFTSNDSTASLASINTVANVPSGRQSQQSKSKKGKATPVLPPPPRTYEKAHKVALQVLEGLNKTLSTDLNSHVALRPAKLRATIDKMDAEEARHRRKYNIKKRSDLRKIKTWLFSIDKMIARDKWRVANDKRILDKDKRWLAQYKQLLTCPPRGNVMNVLEIQRKNLKKVFAKRDAEGFDVPVSALNVLWANRFVRWAEQAADDEAARFAKLNIPTDAVDPALQEGHPADRPQAAEDSGSDSDEFFDQAIKQYGVQKDVRASTYMNFPEFEYKSDDERTELDFVMFSAPEPSSSTEALTPAQRRRKNRLTTIVGTGSDPSGFNIIKPVMQVGEEFKVQGNNDAEERKENSMANDWLEQARIAEEKEEQRRKEERQALDQMYRERFGHGMRLD